MALVTGGGDIGMKAVPAAYPKKRVDDLLYKIGAEDTTPEQAAALMDEPVVTNCRKFVDEHIRKNADVRYRAGMRPMIVRTAAGDCCNWCAAIAGKYDYAEVKNGGDVFRRHARCRCTVEYVCDGKKQDGWSKKMWEADEKTLQYRREYGLNKQSNAAMATGSDNNPWPEGGQPLRGKELSELRRYASERGITLRFFDSFDGDPAMIRDFIDEMSKVAQDYPEVYSAGKGGLQIINDPTINPSTYAITNGRTSIRINTAAFRSRKTLQDDYNKCAEEGKFVPGDAIANIAHHEMGHVICNTYQVSRKKAVEGVDRTKISMYAGNSASEGIAEAISDVYSGRKSREALTIKENYDRLISGSR